MANEVLAGPVLLRPTTLEKTCDSHVGHEHNYDHTTLVLSGRLRVLYRYVQPDGTEVEGETDDLGPGEHVVVLAKVRHTLKALEDDTTYVCIFSHRDLGGVVVERYAALANPRAYL